MCLFVNEELWLELSGHKNEKMYQNGHLGDTNHLEYLKKKKKKVVLV